jgi:D-hydroxyproline dehydrogenase subunit alpha
VPDQPAGRGPRVEITVDGAAWTVPAGCSIAAAFTDRGQPGWRRTRLRAEPRGLSCGIGVCFDCLVTVNGTPGVRACLTEVRPGDVVTTETGSGFAQAGPAATRPDHAGPDSGGPGHVGPEGPGPDDAGPDDAGPDHAGPGHDSAGRAAPDQTRLAPCEVAVIGAGPAGLTAAVTAADAGCAVQLLDLGERPGGQYWRWGPASADGRFHHGWAAFTALRDRLAAHQGSGRIVGRPGHAVFHVEPPGPGRGFFRVHAVAGDRRREYAGIQARAVVVATGAYDLQLPIPGWTLPGVMAAGAAQSLLKGSAVVAGRRVVVAGTGPFLLPVAAGLADAGAQVVAVVEAGQPLDYLRHPAGLAASWRKLPEAAGYLASLARHRVPVLRRYAVIAARGDQRLASVTVARIDSEGRPVPGTERTLEADVLAAGYGFVPQVELLGEAGAELAPSAGALAARTGPDQQTTVAGLFAAGETTGVGGADLAGVEGEIAGRAAARYAGRAIPPPARAAARQRAALRRFAALMHSVHAVRPGWAGWPDEETVVCRCEEVTLARLRAAIDLGADDVRAVKLLARPGMGWCQGRICGPVIEALLAAQPAHLPAGAGLSAPEPGSSRPLAQPVPLHVLAELAGLGRDGAGSAD